MRKLGLLCVAGLTWLSPAMGQQAARAGETAQIFETGRVLQKVSCVKEPEQSYALYLPSGYSPTKTWPVVYFFDPAARGSFPLELMKDAAERHGFILVGSNNSRNGSWKLEAEAAQAMVEDTSSRFSIDSRRVYFAGFSGGARVAAAIALQCKCAAGVLLNGAGFPEGQQPSREAIFAVFAAAGDSDFNLGEVVRLDETLETLHHSHALRAFSGSHQWAPAEVMEEALAWFRLLAMKQGLVLRDSAFIGAQAALIAGRAKNLETSGDLFGAWREYRQAASTLHGLADGTALLQKAEELSKEKSVRDGPKREKQDFEEQNQLGGEISAGMNSLAENSFSDTDARRQLEARIADLRNRAEHEKHPEKQRVCKRVLAGIFVEAMEAGRPRLEAKDFTRARGYFELAVLADPDSMWALTSVAVARAMDGNRKGAIEALRHAKEKTKDAAAFSKWLQDEPAFAKLRDTAAFRALLVAP